MGSWNKTNFGVVNLKDLFVCLQLISEIEAFADRSNIGNNRLDAIRKAGNSIWKENSWVGYEDWDTQKYSLHVDDLSKLKNAFQVQELLKEHQVQAAIDYINSLDIETTDTEHYDALMTLVCNNLAMSIWGEKKSGIITIGEKSFDWSRSKSGNWMWWEGDNKASTFDILLPHLQRLAMEREKITELVKHSNIAAAKDIAGEDYWLKRHLVQELLQQSNGVQEAKKYIATLKTKKKISDQQYNSLMSVVFQAGLNTNDFVMSKYRNKKNKRYSKDYFPGVITGFSGDGTFVQISFDDGDKSDYIERHMIRGPTNQEEATHVEREKELKRLEEGKAKKCGPKEVVTGLVCATTGAVIGGAVASVAGNMCFSGIAPACADGGVANDAATY